MESKLSEIKSALYDLNKGINQLGPHGDLMYYFERNEEIVKAFFKRYCPFKVGELVEITKDIKFEDYPGWAWCQGYLKAGDTAEVKSVDFENGVFVCYVAIKYIVKREFLKEQDDPADYVSKGNFRFDETVCRPLKEKNRETSSVIDKNPLLKSEDESGIDYIDRIIRMVKREIKSPGCSFVFLTKDGTSVIASTGNPPPIELADADKSGLWY